MGHTKEVQDAIKAFNPTMPVLALVFDNADMAQHFKTWLCESGEQAYWDWMEYREEEEEGDITARHFNYHKHPNQIIGSKEKK